MTVTHFYLVTVNWWPATPSIPWLLKDSSTGISFCLVRKQPISGQTLNTGPGTLTRNQKNTMMMINKAEQTNQTGKTHTPKKPDKIGIYKTKTEEKTHTQKK